MAKKSTEVRFSQNTIIVLAVIAVLAWGWNSGWFEGGAADVTGDMTAEAGEEAATGGTTLQVVPQIEKTKIYASTYDLADYEGEKQKNRVNGTADVIKSGNVLETITTTTSSGAASTVEVNGGDKITMLGDATGYYAAAVEDVTITQTLQPFEVFIKDANTPDTSILDDQRDTLSPQNITLDTNDVSKTHYIKVERPGDDTYYNLCGVAANFDDDQIDPRVKDDSGSYTDGEELGDDHDAIDNLGYDKYWDVDQPLMNFDEVEIPFVVGTADDVDPTGETLSFLVYDCEWNLQNGEIVYTNENAGDSDVGLANIELNITVN